MNIQKNVRQLKALNGLVLGYGATVLLLYVALFSSIDLWWWPVILILGSLLLTEIGIVELRQSSQIMTDRFKREGSGTLEKVAGAEVSVSKVAAIPKMIVSVIAVLLILGGLVYVAIHLTADFSFQVTAVSVSSLLAIILHFGVLRTRVYPKLGKAHKTLQEKALPKVEVEKDHLRFMLLFRGKNQKNMPEYAKVFFNEIEKLEKMNYEQVKAMAEFEIGADLKLVAQAAKDLPLYLAKKINRPRAFYHDVKNPNVTHLFVQGKDLVYVVPIPEDQADAALNAWNTWQDRH